MRNIKCGKVEKTFDHLYALRKQNSMLVRGEKTQRQVGIEENNVFNLIKITTKKNKNKD